MTVLVAAKQGENVVLASDKMVSWWHYNKTARKQFSKRRLTFASCGSLRTAQVVENLLEVPAWTEDDTEDGYAFKVAQAIKVLCGQHSLLVGEKADTYMECSFLVVGLEKIYHIDQYFSVVADEHFLADGCGGDFATGAFHALPTDMPLKERVEKAIEVTSGLSLFCGNGIDLKEIEK